jgi:hypothetical protein
VKRIIPVVLLVLVACVCVMPLVGCGGGSAPKSDNAAIEETINAYFAAYNAQDYQKCLDYVTGLTEEMEQTLLEALQMGREQGGPVTVKIENISGSGSTADVSFTISNANASSTSEGQLIKEGGVWKFTLD